MKKRIDDEHEVTIGGAFFQLPLSLNDGSKATLNIWDTGGQERFRSLLKMYYRKAHIAFITYDVGASSSFDSCGFWFNELSKEVPECLPVLVANKTDLPTRRVSSEAGRSLAEKWRAPFFEVSAKQGDGTETMLELVTQMASDFKDKQ
jgi:small GTP-binding protein